MPGYEGELSKLKREVEKEHDRLVAEAERIMELNAKVDSERCGHCVTCRWWDEERIQEWRGPAPWSFCHYNPVSIDRSADVRKTDACDWCGRYRFYEDM